MRCLTLTEPWASLIKIQAKRIETRGWKTSWRGPLAIHAAKGFPADARGFAGCRMVLDLMRPYVRDDIPYLKQFNLGCVIAVCKLVDCLPTRSTGCLSGVFEDYPDLDTGQERAFGNYDEGRYAWVLEDVEPLTVPIPAKGALSLWDWKMPGGPA